MIGRRIDWGVEAVETTVGILTNTQGVYTFTLLLVARPHATVVKQRLNSDYAGAERLRSTQMFSADSRFKILIEQWRLPNGEIVTATRRRLAHTREGNG